MRRKRTLLVHTHHTKYNKPSENEVNPSHYYGPGGTSTSKIVAHSGMTDYAVLLVPGMKGEAEVYPSTTYLYCLA